MWLLREISNFILLITRVLVRFIQDVLGFKWYEKVFYFLLLLQAIVYSHTGHFSDHLDSSIPAFVENGHPEYTYRNLYWFMSMVLICTTAVYKHYIESKSFVALAFVFTGVGVFIDQITGAFINQIPGAWVWFFISTLYSYLVIKRFKNE
jgi:hypothetical protein